MNVHEPIKNTCIKQKIVYNIKCKERLVIERQPLVIC